MDYKKNNKYYYVDNDEFENLLDIINMYYRRYPKRARPQ